MKQISPKAKGFAALFAAAIVYSFFGVFIRVQGHSMSNYAQITARHLLALVLVVVIVAVKRNWRLPRSERPAILLFGIVNTIYPLAMVISTQHIKASNAVMMLYTGGIVAAFAIGTLWFKEKTGRAKVVSVLLALAGLSVFVYPFDLHGPALLGVIMGLVAGVCDALGNSVRKYIQSTPREVLLMTSCVTTVGLLGAATLADHGPAITHQFTLPVYLAVLAHGLCIVVLGYLLVYAFKRIDVNIGTVVLASELFLSMIINHFLLHESPTAHELAGAAIIFAASLLAALGSLKRGSKKPILVGDLE